VAGAHTDICLLQLRFKLRSRRSPGKWRPATVIDIWQLSSPTSTPYTLTGRPASASVFWWVGSFAFESPATLAYSYPHVDTCFPSYAECERCS
jgi:hypothetical protein